MKMVNLRKAKAELSALIGTSQKSPVCLTVHGRPVAVLTGTRGLDFEEILLAWDPEFWKDLDERTQRGRKDSVTLEAFRTSVSRPGVVPSKRATPKRRSPAGRSATK